MIWHSLGFFCLLWLLALNMIPIILGRYCYEEEVSQRHEPESDF